MESNGIVLDDARVAGAQAWFTLRTSRYPGNKIKLGFEDILGHLVDGVRIEEVAKMAGVCASYMRKVYHEDFKMALPENHGQSHKAFSGSATLKKIAGIAAAAGSRVGEPIALPHGLSASASKIILLNGLYYQAHCSRNIFIRRRRKKCRINISRNGLEQMAGVIFFLNVEGYPDRIFIVPSRVILEKYGHQKGELLALFIPLERDRRDKRALLHWWRYENAWPKKRGRPVSGRR